MQGKGNRDYFRLRQTMLFAVLVLTVGMGAGTTYAYIRSEDRLVNIVSGTDTDITIEEGFDPPEEINPGTRIAKTPGIRNTSSNACYVRARICFSDQEAQNQCEPLVISQGWTFSEDGYYYLAKPLGPGELSVPLFEYVKIRDTISKADLKAFDLYVYAEAAGVTGAQSAQEAFALLGG